MMKLHGAERRMWYHVTTARGTEVIKMTKSKAAKILLEEYDTLSCRRMLCNKPDDIDYLNDFLIALLTAIDVLNQSSSVEAEPMGEYISKDDAVGAGYLSDWYISSVGDESPVWTDEHIDELLNDFLVIPKEAPARSTRK